MHVFAHQGGWDELLWFSAPIVVVVLWVRWAERRARVRAGPNRETATPTLPPHDHDH